MKRRLEDSDDTPPSFGLRLMKMRCWVKPVDTSSSEFSLLNQIGSSSNDEVSPYFAKTGNSSPVMIGSFQRGSSLGKGSFGKVWKCKPTDSTKPEVAIKEIKKSDVHNKSYLRETSSLAMLPHKNIVRMETNWTDVDRNYIVLELMPSDLRTFIIYNADGLHLDTIVKIMFQLIAALSFCHSRGIVHRDVKPDNILMDNDKNVKLADFGLSTNLLERSTPLSPDVVTLFYRAPEILLGAKNYGFPVDMWSVGCVFFELITRTFLFRGESENAMLHKIFKFLGTPSSSSWPEFDSLLPEGYVCFYGFPTVSKECSPLFGVNQSAFDLFLALITLCPENRITAENSLIHPFFDACNAACKTIFDRQTPWVPQFFGRRSRSCLVSRVPVTPGTSISPHTAPR